MCWPGGWPAATPARVDRGRAPRSATLPGTDCRAAVGDRRIPRRLNGFRSVHHPTFGYWPVDSTSQAARVPDEDPHVIEGASMNSPAVVADIGGGGRVARPASTASDGHAGQRVSTRL